MRGILQDLRRAVRMVVRERGLALVAILSLGIGIGVNTTAFSALDAMLLRPLPLAGADRLVRLSAEVSLAEYRELHSTCRTLEDLLVLTPWPIEIRTKEGYWSADAKVTSPNYFSSLRVAPALGRFYTERDVTAFADQTVAVISHALWEGGFGSDPGILGQTLRLRPTDSSEAQMATIIGVAPRELSTSAMSGESIVGSTGVWLPIGTAATRGRSLTESDRRRFTLLGRLREGVAASAAQGELSAKLGVLRPAPTAGAPMRLERISRLGLGVPRGAEILFAAFLQSIFAILLLLACTNVACLLIAHAETRRHELGMRLALGCGRWRLMRGVLAESLVLSILGALLALLFADWALEAIRLADSSGVGGILSFSDAHIDRRALLSALVFALLATLGAGLIPLWPKSGADLVDWLRKGSSGATPRLRHGATLRVLVGATVLLLATGLLLVRGSLHGLAQEPGTLRSGRDGLVYAGYKSYQPAFFENLRARLEARPGVRAVSRAASAPNDMFGRSVQCEAALSGAAKHTLGNVAVNLVDPRFLEVVGARVVRGRGLVHSDDRLGAGVALVSEQFQREVWPRDGGLGKVVRLGASPGSSVEIVGVVEDVPGLGGWSRRDSPSSRVVYLPAREAPPDGCRSSRGFSADWTLIVDTEGAPSLLAGAMRDEMRTLDPEVLVEAITTPSQRREYARLPETILGHLVLGLAAMALTLSALGVYGLTSFSVARQTREIGIRNALGASRRTIIVSILRRSLGLILQGMVFGILAALAIGFLLRSTLHGLSFCDPVALGGAVLLLVATTLLAAYLPARRAAKVDPMAALRCE
jgi:predicted permease